MFSKLYRKIILTTDRFVPDALQPLWNSETGPKTIFFWAPLMKWTLVLAGLSDFKRPPEKVSIAQTAALAATGLIWSRYSMVIKPANYSLLAANLFVAATNLGQLGRVANHRFVSQFHPSS